MRLSGALFRAKHGDRVDPRRTADRNEQRNCRATHEDGDSAAESNGTQRLKTAPLPLDDALTIARQIADALEAAHEKGIIHSDLKPANIASTVDGQVKVLDWVDS